jgi:hypothetical protein
MKSSTFKRSVIAGAVRARAVRERKRAARIKELESFVGHTVAGFNGDAYFIGHAVAVDEMALALVVTTRAGATVHAVDPYRMEFADFDCRLAANPGSSVIP